LLFDVPLHDVWAIDLQGGGSGRTIVDLRALVSEEKLRAARLIVVPSVLICCRMN
jgi:hypothetical protein